MHQNENNKLFSIKLLSFRFGVRHNLDNTRDDRFAWELC